MRRVGRWEGINDRRKIGDDFTHIVSMIICIDDYAFLDLEIPSCHPVSSPLRLYSNAMSRCLSRMYSYFSKVHPDLSDTPSPNHVTDELENPNHSLRQLYEDLAS